MSAGVGGGEYLDKPSCTGRRRRMSYGGLCCVSSLLCRRTGLNNWVSDDLFTNITANKFLTRTANLVLGSNHANGVKTMTKLPDLPKR